MIYEQKITGMPPVLRREGGENQLWRRVPQGRIGESHDSFVVLEQKEKLFLFTIGRMSKDMWHGKEISQEEYEQIQDFSDSDLAWFMQP
jgi:hypothetical protein